MKILKKLLLAFFIVVSFLAAANFLFYLKLPEIRISETSSFPVVNNTIKDSIILYSKNLHGIYFFNDGMEDEKNTDIFISNIKKHRQFLNTTYLWKLSNSWITKRFIVNHTHEHIGEVFASLKYTPIIKADLDMRGSQLKFLLTLKGNQEVIFKPKWYPKEKILKGPIYGGKDRHTSEVIGFYMSVILNLPFVPFCVERKLSMKKEILPVSSRKFLDTTYALENRTCVYGKCFYCSKRDPICSDQYDIIIGAVIFNIRKKLKLLKSPWMRTYKAGKLAQWEQNNSYCEAVRNKFSRNRLLEMVDTAIFDFFIQNGDRHHYEILDSRILLIDNGKGLGNPYEDHIDILAPLYQCCVLRKKTWRKLLTLKKNKISDYLKAMPDVEFLNEDHLKALDRRLLLVFGAVEYCRNNKQMILV